MLGNSDCIPTSYIRFGDTSNVCNAENDSDIGYENMRRVIWDFCQKDILILRSRAAIELPF